MTKKQGIVDWEERARQLRSRMAQEQPAISMQIVMDEFGLSTKAAAAYVLEKLAGMGVVRCENHRWYMERKIK